MIGQHVGKYRVLDRIGKGGMGTVYRAMDEMLHRDVAIKVLNAELNDPEVAKRFRAEAITVARLSHPGIATIYELFEHEGQWLMVMEFVRGETLEAMVTRMGPLSAQRSAELCMQALAALAHAHSMGVVHRDLKPANLMITENGAVKVMDFGIARVSGSEHLTNAGFMMGTPAYMAPEQVRGGEVDARADLYAMGVVFFRLTTGKLPFKGDTAFAMAQSQVSEPPTPVATIRADLPPWVEEIVTRALAKAPEQRFQSAAEFHEALARCMAGLPISSMYTSAGETMLTPSRMPSGAISSRAMPTPSASFPMPTPTAAQQAAASGPQQTVMSGSHPATASGAQNRPPSGAQPVAHTGATDPTMAAPSGAQPRPAPTGAVTATASASAKAPAENPVTAKAPADKKQIPLVWIGIAGAVVLTVIVVAITVLRGGGDSDQLPPPVPPATTGAAVTPAAGSDALAPTNGSAAATATPAPPLTTPVATPGRVGPPLPTMTPARGSAPATSIAPGATTTPTPGPGAGADSPEAFPNAKMFLTTGKRDVKDAVIHFGNGQVSITVKGVNTGLASLAYKRITKATYVHGRDPLWDANLASPPKDFDVNSFMGSLLSRSPKNWLVLQGTDHCEVLRLDDSNFKKILDTLEARTGVKVDKR